MGGSGGFVVSYCCRAYGIGAGGCWSFCMFGGFVYPSFRAAVGVGCPLLLVTTAGGLLPGWVGGRGRNATYGTIQLWLV